MEEQQNTQQSSGGGMDGKTIGIISYLTWIGLLIAFIMNNDKKDSLAAFHIRQSLGITLLGIATWIIGFILAMIHPILGALVWILYIGLLILWILGLIGAINGEKKLVPVFGEMFQNWFKGIQSS